VIKTDEALVRAYAAGNPVAIDEASALAAGGSFGDALDVAETHGYGFDPSNVVMARLELDDGREAVLGIGKLSGGVDGVVVYTRVGDRDETIPLRLAPGTPEGVEILRTGGKGELEPDNIPVWTFFGSWWQCVMQAMADIMACIQQCPDGSCWQACIMQALLRLASCLSFTMM
jgi:hypothetical protein